MAKDLKGVQRRELLAGLATLGIGSATFQRSLSATVSQQSETKSLAVTAEMIQQAEWVAGVSLNDEQRKTLAKALTTGLKNIAVSKEKELPNSLPPAFIFQAQPGQLSEKTNDKGNVTLAQSNITKPEKSEELAFLPAHQLAHLLNTKQVSSVELAKLYLDRLHKYNEKLKFVVTFTDDLAMKQAKQADEERAAGKIRGPWHGIPWGAKDLIAVPGYKTTWGAAKYKDQTIDTKATVVQKLEDQGMVLLAKLTLGALAWGDQWFGGQTKNPWDIRRGSSGSSAGSASAVVSGCVPVAVGSETLGSIISPSRECGATGLRPTFGHVSRAGCMTLCWTMDKLGPLARTVEDCAMMLHFMHGADPADASSVTRRFDWQSSKPIKQLRIGIVEGSPKSHEAITNSLREMGAEIKTIKLPSQVPQSVLSMILACETATAFEDITRAGVVEGIGLWPNTFREGRFYTAVDYIRANRLRTLLMQEMAKFMETVDVYISSNDLLLTNMTGHPSICLPIGSRTVSEMELPTTITLTGQLFGESDLLTVAKTVQDVVSKNVKRPNMEKLG